MGTVLRTVNIKKTYGSKGNITEALNGISFEVENGEYMGIMGASGSGKTTLLNCVSTIDTVTSGDIFIKNKNITNLKQNELADFRRKKLGFIFQDFNLLDTLTAFENIALSLAIEKTSQKLISSEVNRIAKRLNIENILNKYPYQMSGGQKQRVASARAIITHPALILADEPTGALDSKSAKMLLDSFETLNDDFGATILIVTHDAFTASYCRRIMFIQDGKIFKELKRETETRKQFFDKIMEVISSLGGGIENVC